LLALAFSAGGKVAVADQQEHASNRADKDDTYPRKGPTADLPQTCTGGCPRGGGMVKNER
jgi:hypothetical protein